MAYEDNTRDTQDAGVSEQGFQERINNNDTTDSSLTPEEEMALSEDMASYEAADTYEDPMLDPAEDKGAHVYTDEDNA